MTYTNFRPMLAAKITNADLDDLDYPLYMQPKFDGIRCLVSANINSEDPVFSRSLKPIPNKLIVDQLSVLKYLCLDGELTMEAPNRRDSFNFTTGFVRQHLTSSNCSSCDSVFRLLGNVTYNIFDCFQQPTDPFYRRHNSLMDFVELPHRQIKLNIVQKQLALHPGDVSDYYAVQVDKGYEGIILRASHSPYKFNRSTVKQGYLLKLKGVQRFQATILDCKPLLRNHNKAQTDSLGLTKRTSHKDNKVADDLLGKFIVQDTEEQFSQFAVGSGFTEAERIQLWEIRSELKGKKIWVEYQAHGSIERPRAPIFKGFVK